MNKQSKSSGKKELIKMGIFCFCLSGLGGVAVHVWSYLT
jgi:hypothetical protein